MADKRRIHKVIKSRPTIEGAGVHLHRAIGFGDQQLFDPFLLLDDFRSDEPKEYLKGFPWHPHRGIETITYVLRGDVEHGDSMGNSGVISSGDVQWMTAGSGIIHQEMPKGDAKGAMYGFQLWANLPAANKMMDPRYRGVTSAEIPEVTDPTGNRIKVIAGQVEGVNGTGAATSSPARSTWTSPCAARLKLHSPYPKRPHRLRVRDWGRGDLLPAEGPFQLRSRRGQVLRHGTRRVDRRWASGALWRR